MKLRREELRELRRLWSNRDSRRPPWHRPNHSIQRRARIGQQFHFDAVLDSRERGSPATMSDGPNSYTKLLHLCCVLSSVGPPLLLEVGAMIAILALTRTVFRSPKLTRIARIRQAAEATNEAEPSGDSNVKLPSRNRRSFTLADDRERPAASDDDKDAQLHLNDSQRMSTDETNSPSTRKIAAIKARHPFDSVFRILFAFWCQF